MSRTPALAHRRRTGFAPIEWAVVKNVWSLDGSSFRDCVVSQTFYQASTKEFLDAVDQDHPIRDYIFSEGKKYEVCYIDTGFSHIESVEKQNKAPLLAICLRVLKGFEDQGALGVALIRVPFKGIPVENYPLLKFEG